VGGVADQKAAADPLRVAIRSWLVNDVLSVSSTTRRPGARSSSMRCAVSPVTAPPSGNGAEIRTLPRATGDDEPPGPAEAILERRAIVLALDAALGEQVGDRPPGDGRVGEDPIRSSVFLDELAEARATRCYERA